MLFIREGPASRLSRRSCASERIGTKRPERVAHRREPHGRTRSRRGRGAVRPGGRRVRVPTARHARPVRSCERHDGARHGLDRPGRQFDLVNPHQISIYAPGKRPKDVDTSIRAAMPAGCPNPGGNALIADPVGLLASWADRCNAPRQPITYQFDEPGRHLVICSFDPHFQIGMYGWVIVRDR